MRGKIYFIRNKKHLNFVWGSDGIAKTVFFDERVLNASFRVCADATNCASKFNFVINLVQSNGCFEPMKHKISLN